MESLLKGDAPDAITFEKIHGRNGKMIKAKDLDLLRFAPRGLPPEVSHLLPTSAQHADSMQALHWQPVLEESALFCSQMWITPDECCDHGCQVSGMPGLCSAPMPQSPAVC